MMRRLAMLCLGAVLATLIGWRVLHPSVAARDAPAGVVFYAAEPGVPLRLAIDHERELQLAVRFRGAIDGQRHSLELVFRALDSTELGRESVGWVTQGPSDPSSGVVLSEPRWITLVPPPAAAVLEIIAINQAAAVRLTAGTPDVEGRGPSLRRAHLEESLLSVEQQQRVTRLKWTPMPALSVAKTLLLTAATPLALPDQPPAQPGGTLPAARADDVDAHHSAALNLLGPGRARVVVHGHGRFRLRVIGAGKLESPSELAAEAPRALELPTGPVSVQIEALADAIGTTEVVLDGATRLALTACRQSMSRMSRAQTLRYRLDGNEPLRVSVRGAGLEPGQIVSWKLLRAGRELQQGQVSVEARRDLFSTAVRDGLREPVSLPITQLLQPEGADLLELSSGAELLVGVDVRIEQGADSRPTPPFVSAPAGYRWVAVPVRAARWLALPEESAHSAARTTLACTPRLEAITSAHATSGPMLSVHPLQAEPVRVIETSQRELEHPVSSLRAPGDARIRIAQTGAHARQLSAACTPLGAPSAALQLSSDGRALAHARVTTQGPQLRAALPAGEQHVRIDGAPALCVLDAAPAHAAAQARRSVFELRPERVLRLPVTTAGKTRVVHLAIYRADSEPGRLRVRIDGGNPLRRRGAVERLTQPVEERDVGTFAGEATRLADGALLRRSFGSVALGDDLAPGHHLLELSYVGRSTVWVRFWTAGQKHRTEKVSLWISEEASE